MVFHARLRSSPDACRCPGDQAQDNGNDSSGVTCPAGRALGEGELRAPDARNHQAVSRVCSRSTASTSRRRRARCTRCSARTAPARRRSRTSSPASTGRTTGEILLYGAPVRFASPRQAIDAGVCMVHQQFRLVERLTVAENIILGDRRGAGRTSVVDPRAVEGIARARRALPAPRRSARAHLAALGRRAAAGRDPQGALPGRADPDPRRADRPSSRPRRRTRSSSRFGRWRPRAGRSSSSRTSCTR